MANAQISAFWQWFLNHEAQIRAAYDRDDLQALDALLSDRVAEIAGGAGWEMGPYALPGYTLVLAPGTRDRIPVCREVIDAAPDLAEWSFFAGLPPKEMVSLELEIGGAVVCCDAWRYRLTAYNRGEFVDLDIFFEPDVAPPGEKEEETCELLVQSLVGETVALERIGYIQHHRVDSVDAVENASAMKYLRPHLEQVLSPLQ